jgi:hypothetical protein
MVCQTGFVKIQSGGKEQTMRCCRPAGRGGERVLSFWIEGMGEGNSQSQSVHGCEGFEHRPKIDHKDNREGEGREYKISIQGKLHSKELILGRRRCPGEQTWERLERTVSSPTRGREWAGELAKPRHQGRTRSTNLTESTVP